MHTLIALFMCKYERAWVPLQPLPQRSVRTGSVRTSNCVWLLCLRCGMFLITLSYFIPLGRGWSELFLQFVLQAIDRQPRNQCRAWPRRRGQAGLAQPPGLSLPRHIRLLPSPSSAGPVMGWVRLERAPRSPSSGEGCDQTKVRS